MYAEQPRKLVLVGVLGADEIDNLTAYCRRLFASGQMTVKLDMASVSDCHRAAVDGLTALRAGSAGLGVSVEGACWPQFFLLLAQTPTVEINDVCIDIRALVPVPRSH